MSRQYMSAAKAVDAVDSGRQSFKSYCGSSGTIGKVDFAIAAETIKYSTVLESIFEIAGVSADKLDVGNGMLKVMSYELLFGKNKISGGGAVKRAIMEVKDKLLSALDEVMKAKGVSEHQDLLSEEVTEAAKMPKYVRINEIKMPSVALGLSEIKKACPLAVFDDMIPSLVVLPPGKSLGEHPYVKDGRLIIQDKASCFPSQCLYDVWSETKVGDIIDACAAPGNKTSHVAALTGRHRKEGINCKIFAFDKNPVRAKLLEQRMAAAGAQDMVKVSNEDFLGVDIHSAKYKHVTCVLLDPSCSGSGVARVLERVIERQAGTESVIPVDVRLMKLRAFQIAALKKAMSFPSVQYVVYSTCSIHEEENESVVAEVLWSSSSEETDEGAAGEGAEECSWAVAEPQRLVKWARRGQPFHGLPTEQQQRLIRCHPSDGLNGFFVAVLQKQSRGGSSSSGTLDPEAATETLEMEEIETMQEIPHRVDGPKRKVDRNGVYPRVPDISAEGLRRLAAHRLSGDRFEDFFNDIETKRAPKRHRFWRPADKFSANF